MAAKRAQAAKQWTKETQAHFSKCLHILKALHYSDLNKPNKDLSPSSSSRGKRASKELDEVGPRPEGLPFDNRFPQDLYVKKGYTPSEQIGIAMLALQQAGQMVHIEWTRQVRLLPRVLRN